VNEILKKHLNSRGGFKESAKSISFDMPGLTGWYGFNIMALENNRRRRTCYLSMQPAFAPYRDRIKW